MLNTKTRILPVSRVSFALTDRSAFDKAVAASVRWIARTAQDTLPDEAVGGAAFEFTAAETSTEVSALRLDDEQGRVWAAKVAFKGDRVADRNWITDLFVEQRVGSFVRFGAQLTCECTGNDPGFEHSRPRVIKSILDILAAEADDEALSNKMESVDSDGIPELVSLLEQPDRRLPVVLVSVDDKGRGPVDLRRLSNRLSGAAHLRCVGIDASFALTDAVGKRLSTYQGAIRIYMPGLIAGQPGSYDHPLWLAPRSGYNPRLINDVAARVLPLGFRDADGDARFWRIGLLRQATLQANAARNASTKEERDAARIDAIVAEAEVARQDKQAAESLMFEESIKLDAARAEIAELKESAFELRSKLEYVSPIKSAHTAILTPDNVYSVFCQCPSLETSLIVLQSLFSDRLEILDSAFSSARASINFQYRKKAFELLWSLATSYWSALSGGDGDGTARQCFGAAYAAKETEKLSKNGRQRRTFVYKGNSLEMERHLKIGVADNKSDTLRIHFEWIGSEQKIVIGHCGGHIDF